MQAWLVCICALCGLGSRGNWWLDVVAATPEEPRSTIRIRIIDDGVRTPASEDDEKNSTDVPWTERFEDWITNRRLDFERWRANQERWWPRGHTTPLPDAPAPGPSSSLSWPCGSHLTTLFSGIGWAVCCARWPGIKSLAARCAGMAVSWSCSIAFPLVFSACWPLVDALGWAIAAAVSILRWAAASGQRRFLTRGGKKFTLELYGPDVARPPDTALLRKAKSAREVARVVLCVGGEVAEVLADPQRCEAINRHPDTPKAWKVSLRVRNEPLVCAGVLSKERRQRMQIVHRTEARADQLAIVCRDVGGV